jgi:superfamily I DNA/RNA helicase/RecB family exonuclease
MPSKPSSASPSFAPDDRQRQAIEHDHGPMLVVAGAGTGKTTVLTRRIARLIREEIARPHEILALTYTDNAAREMRERVQQELGARCKVQATTFHAYCFGLLDRRGRKFDVLDDKDLWIYLRKRIRDLHLDYFVRAANVGKFLDDLLDFMRRCQDELVTPAKYAGYVQQLELGELPVPRVTRSKEVAEVSDQEVIGRCREIASVYATVERMLAESNLGTFGHMITRAYDLLCGDANLLAEERRTARFLLVDEFQDVNFAQVKILSLLAGDERNIFAVGDPDQAIYRFRGASSAAFALFESHFPGAKLVSLEKNQRSTTPILRCAFGLISRNPEFTSSKLGSGCNFRRSPLASAREQRAASEGKELAGTPVEAVTLNDKDVESADLLISIRRKQKQLKCQWRDFAVLYRSHLHRDEIAEELARRQIPFTIENFDVLDAPEVRDLLACLAAVVSPSDGAGLFRVAALPQFGIDPNQLRAAMKAAGRDIRLTDVLERVAGGPAVLKKLQEARDEIKASLAKAHAALGILIRHFSLAADSPAINAVRDFVAGWETKPLTLTREIGELVEYLDYFREAHGTIPLPTTEDDAVRLMTAHSAKGLEFDHVFIIRANSGSFPLGFREALFEFPRELRAPDSAALEEGKELNEQEERRLFYVAMTRARDSLSIYAKRGKGKDATPPGFVREMLKDATLRPWLVGRNAAALQVDLFAGEDLTLPPEARVNAWLRMDPVFDLSVLSATAVEVYETCPLQFKLEREWRIPGEVPAAMQYGASIHRVLRTYYDAQRLRRPISETELVALFREDLLQAKIEDPYQHELYEGQGIEQLRDFLAAANRAPAPEVLATEKEFRIKIGSASVVGRIDRIDRLPSGGVAIVDYKTGKPRSQEDADESLQLSIYALAARDSLGYKPERLVFYNLENNQAMSTTRSEVQLQEAVAKVEDVAEAISAGEFQATPGFHCAFCAYRNLCPETEKRIYPPVRVKRAASRAN